MIQSLKTEKISVLKKLNPSTSKNNLFIFAVGYEQRSIAIYEAYIQNLDVHKLCFLFDDYEKHPNAIMNKIQVDKFAIETKIVGYNDNEKVLNFIVNKISEVRPNEEGLNIHIDYSSMPRNWYCCIPPKINSLLKPKDKVYFWYSEGQYEKRAEDWPSAGIEDVKVFYGKASLRQENNRCHIMGLGFDSLRSQAIYSVLDPNFLVVSYSFPATNKTMRDVIKSKNSYLINTAAFTIELPIDDFAFMISKIYETVIELYSNGDVILVPDGPKPQILASSLVPFLFKKTGVICFHIKRHEGYYKPVNVKAKGGIFGFSYSSLGSI